MNYISKNIAISPRHDLGKTAAILGEIFGLRFDRDISGKYEEFPAFVAGTPFMRLTLLGPPEPEFDIREVRDSHFELFAESETLDRNRDISAWITKTIAADGRLELLGAS